MPPCRRLKSQAGSGKCDMNGKNMKQLNENVILNEGQVPYLTFPKLEALGFIRHAFSTRLGGVSQGDYASMNLSFTRGDDPEAVAENYRRMAGALGVDPSDMVLSDQTHTTNVRVMTAADRGKGVTAMRDYKDVDGMVTDVPGLMLVTSYADCVPLYFADPVKRVIGLSHSGWRGTVGHMGAETVRVLHEVYGSRPEDLVCMIGPSICQDCYEVSEDVALEFQKAFTEAEAAEILLNKGHGKYQLDLWKANFYVLRDAGVPETQIGVSGLCTYDHSDLLWSHRKTGGKRGGLSAFLQIKEEQV